MEDYFSKSNTGGAIASRGFTYQDYCSLIELFKVVDNPTFKAISIETLDDFTIFIDDTEVLYQVKKMQFDVKIVNKVLEKDIDPKIQRFIFTSKDTSKYNGLFDKLQEYRESKKSSRSSNEKEKIKSEIKKIIEDNKILNSEKFLDSEVLIYEDSNIKDIFNSKFNDWLESKKIYINNKNDFLDKLRMVISDKKSSRSEFKKEEFDKIANEFKVDKVKEEPYNERFQFLKQRYNKVEELKKAIFSYYPSYGTNVNDFKEASTFDELFDILQREKDYLNCILKEMGKEVDDLTIDCKNLKLKSESSKEINKIIVRIDSLTNNLKDCQINGYIGFSSESFDAIENSNEALEFTKSNHSQILSDYIDSILHGRSCAKIIELQLLLPNQLFKLNFEIKDKRIRIIKRLLFRIENHEQLEEDEIRFWKRNSDFYHSHKSQKICKDSICSLDENELSDFREDEEIDEHICVISDECLSHSVRDIYKYGITIVLYPYNNSCTIINTIDFKNKPIRNIKNMIFKFMKKNQKTHFIYDDYNDLDFLKQESKVEGTDDDYL